jgi:uncharacterized membrane protein
MPFCASCGSAVDGSFCAKCGAPAGAAGPPPINAQSNAQSYAQAAPAAGMTENVAAALCYSLGILTGILFLVLAPYNQNRTIKFHAFQSIFMHLACIVLWIAGPIVLGIMHLWMLDPLIWLACFGLWLYLLITAYQGKTVVLPIIGPIAQQQARN